MITVLWFVIIWHNFIIRGNLGFVEKKSIELKAENVLLKGAELRTL